MIIMTALVKILPNSDLNLGLRNRLDLYLELKLVIWTKSFRNSHDSIANMIHEFSNKVHVVQVFQFCV